MSHDAPRRVVSTRDISLAYGTPIATVAAIVDRLGIADRVGRNRVIMSEDIPRVVDALRGGGYLMRPSQEDAHV
jgi:hypothetical protein